MNPIELRARLKRGALDFAWDEWAQMGVLAAPRRRSSWAEDPEALLVFTIEVGRDDPRLFDEVLDWLVVNESFLSVRRLRAMASESDDRRLLDAVLGWLSQYRPRARLQRRSDSPGENRAERLFRDLSSPIRDPDPAFAERGFHRPVARPTGKARNPDLRLPINFGLRLRELLGVGARAEVVRHLLTSPAPAVTAQVLARSAGYTQRNVHESLLSLHAAGVVSQLAGGSQQRYEIDRENWARLLALDVSELPEHREWPQLLRGLRVLLRWLQRPDLEQLSEYLLASQARDLLESVRDDFEHAGLPVGRATADDAWLDLETLADQCLRVLRVAPDLEIGNDVGDSQPPNTGAGLSFQVYADARGAYRWRLMAANGEVMATSGESFVSRANAVRDAETFRSRADAWRYEVFADASGHHRWRARASDGRTVASSEAFSSRSTAETGADRTRVKVRAN